MRMIRGFLILMIFSLFMAGTAYAGNDLKFDAKKQSEVSFIAFQGFTADSVMIISKSVAFGMAAEKLTSNRNYDSNSYGWTSNHRVSKYLYSGLDYN